jgi:hypothetical protein
VGSFGQLAAEQQKPLGQALGAVQSMLQLLPLQWEVATHEPFPRQATRLRAALEAVPAWQEV